MNKLRTPIGAILKVNGHFLLACLFGGVAWLVWPTNPEWWGLGLLSILLGASGLGSFLAAIRAMAKLYVRERELARFVATARTSDPSDLVDQNTLKNAGMFDE